MFIRPKMIYLLVFLISGFGVCKKSDAEKLSTSPCADIYGNFVDHGALYVPGPNICTQCVCYQNMPKWCKTIFCNGPNMCKDFKLGKTCCQFECFDPPTLKPEHNLSKSIIYSGSLRYISLFLIFFFTLL